MSIELQTFILRKCTWICKITAFLFRHQSVDTPKRVRFFLENIVWYTASKVTTSYSDLNALTPLVIPDPYDSFSFQINRSFSFSVVCEILVGYFVVLEIYLRLFQSYFEPSVRLIWFHIGYSGIRKLVIFRASSRWETPEGTEYTSQ